MRTTFTHTKISGIITLVPEQYIHIDDELHTIYQGDQKALERIKKVVGLKTRHIAPKDITASDMALSAANILLDSMHIERSNIDVLIFITQTPDYFLPASACYLHGKLGLNTHTFAFDINQACAGYLYGLYVAHSLIDSGGAKRVLMLCGDTLSHFVNPLDSSLAPIIGDGVSATLLEYTQETLSAYFELGSDGTRFDKLIIPQGACRIPNKAIITDPKVWETSESRGLHNLYMDGTEIFNFAIMEEPGAFEKIIEYAGIAKEQLDYYFFHQANKYIVDNIAKRLKLDTTKVPNETTGKYGNLSGCSIPASICDTFGDTPLKKDLQISLAGFGAGLSFGNAILHLRKDFYTQKVMLYNKNNLYGGGESLLQQRKWEIDNVGTISIFTHYNAKYTRQSYEFAA